MDLNHDGVFDLNDVIIIAVAITAILAAMVALRRQVVKPVSRWVKRQLVEVVEETVTPMLETIKHEVTANDGGSLKDLVRENQGKTIEYFRDRDERLAVVLDERDKAFARIAGPADQRMRHVESAVKVLDKNQRQILGRLDELGAQSAADTEKVLQKIDHNTDNIIDNQKETP